MPCHIRALQQNVTRSVALGEPWLMLIASETPNRLIAFTKPIKIMYQVTTYSGIQQGWRHMGTRDTPELALQLLTALSRIKPSFKHRIQCDLVDVPWQWISDEVPLHY